MNKFVFYIFIIVFSIKTGTVFSNTNIFNVDNIVIINNKNTNKEELLNKAFKKGFYKLIKNILLSKDFITASKTDINTIRNLVSTYQIIENKELNSDKFFVNINFDKIKINEFFHKNNISYADIFKSKIILFPILIKGEKMFLFSENFFYKNWINEQSINEDKDFIEYILPSENLNDIRIITKFKDNLELINVEKLLSGYDIKDYIFLAINIFDKNTNIYMKGKISNKNIVKNFKLDNDTFQNQDVIKKIKFEISEIWKAQNLINVRTPSFLNIILDINKKDDLLNLQNTLATIDIIQNYSVVELNKNYAKIKIKYIGKIDKIKNKFDERNIEIKFSSNVWKLRLI